MRASKYVDLHAALVYTAPELTGTDGVGIWRDRQTDRQTETETDRQTDRQRHRERQRQTETETGGGGEGERSIQPPVIGTARHYKAGNRALT